MYLTDHHILSNFQDVYSTHIHLDLNIDFENRVITGKATYDIIHVN